jgi:anti-sigma factor RsiW
MSRPTDLELMAYFDGELEEPRRTEVTRWLESDAAGDDVGAAQQKLAGLALGAEWVQSTAPRTTEADPAAVDAILAAIRTEQVPSASPTVSREAANDNQRWTVGVLALVSAAAAALFLWPRAPDTPPGVASAGSSAPRTVTSSASMIAGTTASSGAVDAAVGVDDDVQGVQVATIDFGARTGAIYNVVSDVFQDGGAGAEKHVATTVVWIADP